MYQKKNIKVSITYFNKDTYKTINDYIKEIDNINKIIILSNREKIAFNDILNIDFENNIE